MTEYTFTRADVGCYLDGAMGWHNTYRVIELAQSHGYALSDADARYVSAYRDGLLAMISPQSGDAIGLPEIADAVREIADDATEYLYTITEPGLVWDWDAGELCLLAGGDEGDPS